MPPQQFGPGRVKSCVPLVDWPGLPDRASGTLLGILYQLEHSQWWTPDRLQAAQFRQLRAVVPHAVRTIPLYKERFAAAGLDPAGVCDPERWTAVPLLSRRDLQTADPPLLTAELPPGHGPPSQLVTSGSTGQPVAVWKTAVERLYWLAFSIRDHLWHARDFDEALAVIRYMNPEAALPPRGAMRANWDKALAGIFPTGPAFMLNIRSDVDEQAQWLAGLNPGYLLTYPSVLAALAEHFQRSGTRLTNLKQLRTFGEALDAQTRVLCRRVFGLPIADMYSSQEVGYIATQCPQEEHYHVQSENVLVEILDDAGRVCEAGQIGRVVVTSLHNLATPLLRYDIGDYAEVGPPCPCGRGLPVLRRILGRQRNLMRLPNGERRWPGFAEGDRPVDLPPFSQFQLVQKAVDLIEVRVVLPRPWTEPERDRVRDHLHRSLGYPFRLEFSYVDAIPRSPSGKFEEFRCEIA